jgi:excisionase family DNA binding protein
MTSNNFEALWTVQDVADFLKLAPKTIRNKVSANEIPSLKIGGSLRFRPEDIREWVILKSAEAEGKADAARSAA